MIYPTQRNLCGVYFRVKRDGRWQNVCFSDMTNDERKALDAQSRMSEQDQLIWWRNLACVMADALHELGDLLEVNADDQC